MKNFLVILSVTILILIYLFLYLGIELELKNVIERLGVKTNQLIDTSFKIRKFVTIQLLIFFLSSAMCIYFIIRKK